MKKLLGQLQQNTANVRHAKAGLRSSKSLLYALLALVLLVGLLPATLSASAQTTNLALNRPVTCSSIENAGTACANAVDGNGGTRWASAFSDPQWIQVDLGATYNITRVVLTWEAAYGRSYQSQVSGSASGPWTNIYTTTTGNGATDDLTGLSGSGRYVRMNGTVRATQYGYSLWEFQVYGTSGTGPTATRTNTAIGPTPTRTNTPPASGTNIALNKPVTCSSTENAGTPCASGVDGSMSTRWASAFSDPQWIQVDLGSTATISRVVLNWEAAYGSAYQIQVSGSATGPWTNIYTTTTGNGATDDLSGLSGSGRYIRMNGTTRATAYGYSLYEFQVFGTGGATPTPGPTVTPIPTTTGWNLVWSDEFNGPTVDLGSWSFQTGCSGWGNGEWEDYTNGANTSFESGVLVIEARMKPGAALGNCGMTSTRMNTSGKRSWLYGKMEARLAIPMGQGVWPAFWMMGNTGGWPSNGEIDIMEHINSTTVNVGTLHWDNNGHQSSGTSVTVSNMTSYHIYGIEWDATQIRFYVDGNYYNTINISAVPQPAFHQPSYFLLNLAIGGAWPGYPTSTSVMPARYYIDYVRVYQH